MDTSLVDRISNLPLEILRLIIRNISSDQKQHLNTLCRVSKLFLSLIAPVLYEVLEIEWPEGFNPRFSALKQFSAEKDGQQIDFTSSFQHVRDLALTTSIKNLRDREARCWHFRLQTREENGHCIDRGRPRKCDCGTGNGSGEYLDDAKVDTKDECQRCNSNLDDDPNFEEEHLLNFCENLAENSLRSFSWGLGACVPSSILGPRGYLVQHQTNLRRLSLITSARCEDYNNHPKCEYDLTKFDQIRHLSWTSPRLVENFEAIRDCLVINAEHLEVLKLGGIDRSNTELLLERTIMRYFSERDRRPHCFAQDVLGIHANNGGTTHAVSLPCLQTLYLSELSFCFWFSELASALNMFRLRHLVLWNCPGITLLLQHLTTSDLQLVSLELTCNYRVYCEIDNEGIGLAVAPFLRKFTGLRDLFLALDVSSWNEIIDAVNVHSKTLRRVILHSPKELIGPEELYDPENKDRPVDLGPGFRDLFTNSVTEMIATSHALYFLENCLGPLAQNITCKILHYRTPDGYCLSNRVMRDDIEYFADWLFGPTGLPNLLIFVYGNLSSPGICQTGDYIIYYRDHDHDQNYKVTTSVDQEDIWHQLAANMDSLSACPYEQMPIV